MLQKRIVKRSKARAAREDACVIVKDGREYCVYPLDDIVEALGKKWSLLLIGIIGNKSRTRFHEIQEALPGISPRTLTDRLRDLEKLRLVERRVFAEVPPRVEYTLSKNGSELRDALIPLLEWAASRPS